MTAPGWYRDPAGRDGDARWWDGTGWTDAHVPRESVDAVPDPPRLPEQREAVTTVQPWDVVGASSPGDQAWARQRIGAAEAVPTRAEGRAPGTLLMSVDGGEPPPAPPVDRRTVRLTLLGLGAVAVVLVLLLVTGVFSPGGDDDETPDLGAIPTGASPPSDPGGATPIRIVDKDAGISYKFLGQGWRQFDLNPQGAEMQTTAGQYVVTQEEVPDGGEFIAQVTSGLLQPTFGGGAPSGWGQVLQEVKASVSGNYYPQPNTAKEYVDKAVTIDGKQAYQLCFDLKWDVAGYDSTGERACLLLIDSGKAQPALMYLSFPNTHAELYPLIDEAIASVTVP